jgi:hypothetical protein
MAVTMKSTIYWDVILCLLSLLFSLQDGSGMLVSNYQAAQHHIPEDSAVCKMRIDTDNLPIIQQRRTNYTVIHTKLMVVPTHNL